MARQLEIIKGPDKGRKFFLKDGGKLLLGRSRKTGDPLSDRNVSRAHCEVKVEDDQVFIIDLDSQSGTFVNGKRIKEQAINSGDIIAIGGTQLRYLSADEDSDPAGAEPVVPTGTVIEPPRKPVVPTETVVEPPKKQSIPTETVVEPPKKKLIPTETIMESPGKVAALRGPAGKVPEAEVIKKTDTVVERHPPRLEGRERAPFNPFTAEGLRVPWIWLVIGVVLAFLLGVALTWTVMRAL